MGKRTVIFENERYEANGGINKQLSQATITYLPDLMFFA